MDQTAAKTFEYRKLAIAVGKVVAISAIQVITTALLGEIIRFRRLPKPQGEVFPMKRAL